jgi:hypothetical protein
MIDRWTSLGHPLLVSLTAPSAAGPDPQALYPLPPSLGGQSDLAWQRTVVDHIVPVLLAKNSVQAIVWNQWTDTHPHEFAHGGLIDATGKAKPALKSLAELKKRYLA